MADLDATFELITQRMQQGNDCSARFQKVKKKWLFRPFPKCEVCFLVKAKECFFFLLIALWSRHVKPSSAKGEKRLKREKIPKFVQAEALPESEIMYKSKDRCTGMKDRITRDREIQRYAKTYQKPSPQTSVHLEQQVELRKKVESGSTIADSAAA